MSNNLTKRDIVLDIYDKTDFPQKEVRETVQLTLDTIAKALSEGRNVELRNFGVFEVQIRKSRIGRNPNKPETDVIIPKRAVIKFKAGKELKALKRFNHLSTNLSLGVEPIGAHGVGPCAYCSTSFFFKKRFPLLSIIWRSPAWPDLYFILAFKEIQKRIKRVEKS